MCNAAPRWQYHYPINNEYKQRVCKGRAAVEQIQVAQRPLTTHVQRQERAMAYQSVISSKCHIYHAIMSKKCAKKSVSLP